MQEGYAAVSVGGMVRAQRPSSDRPTLVQAIGIVPPSCWQPCLLMLYQWDQVDALHVHAVARPVAQRGRMRPRATRCPLTEGST